MNLALKPAPTLAAGPVALPAKQRPAAFYLPQLDVLRFGAFVAVFLADSFPDRLSFYESLGVPHAMAVVISAGLASGTFGVDLFFVLSSFLITTLLLREIRQRGAVDSWAFYVRRTLRIWPLYFLFVLGYFFFQNYIPKGRLSGLHLPQLLPFLFFVGNFEVMHNPSIQITHMWSLSVEEQFYIAWALVMRWVKVSCIPWIAAGAIVLSIAARLFNHSDIGVVMCSTVTRLDPLAMGTLVACGAFFPGPMRRPWAWIAAAVAFIVGTEIVLPFYEPAIANAMADYFLVAVACAVILTAVLELRPGKGPIIRALTYLGKLSYGLYVLSPLTLWFLRSWIPDRHFRGYVLRAVLSFTMTIVLAIISYELFEKWFLVIKKRFTYIPSRSA